MKLFDFQGNFAFYGTWATKPTGSFSLLKSTHTATLGVIPGNARGWKTPLDGPGAAAAAGGGRPHAEGALWAEMLPLRQVWQLRKQVFTSIGCHKIPQLTLPVAGVRRVSPGQ